MPTFVSAVLDGPAITGVLKELSTLTGRTVMSLKKAWDANTPVFVMSTDGSDTFESSVQTLSRLMQWADGKGIGMTLCNTDFDPDNSVEAMQFGKDRELIFNRFQTCREIRYDTLRISALEVPNYFSAVLDGPVIIGALKELSTLTGRSAMSVKKAWEGNTPVFVMSTDGFDAFESSVQTFKKLTEWADGKGVGMTLCETDFDPDGSTEARQFGEDREIIFNRLQAWYAMIFEEGYPQIAAFEEAYT